MANGMLDLGPDDGLQGFIGAGDDLHAAPARHVVNPHLAGAEREARRRAQIDEVLAVGDMEFQKKCLGKMGEVAQQGRTVLFVSHKMREMLEIVELEAELACWDVASVPPALLRRAKSFGLTNARIAVLLHGPEKAVAAAVEKGDGSGFRRVYKRVDTCAAEFPALTPYLYSTWGTEDETEPDERPKVVILGAGPNRIGQGIEFDYCCVHAAYSLREAGFEAVMINCNPETVSTDYDTSDRLYFEPLTLEHVLAVLDREKPQGVIVQLGGQTPLKLARGLAAAGIPILGTSPDAIDLAEDRKRFGALLAEEGILQPENGTATSTAEALEVARRIGFPVVVRPSYVLGGRAMAVVYDEDTLIRYMREAADVSPGHPILIDRFLEDAFELDVDLLADGKQAVIAGLLQHIEEAGIHSGDSACALPPVTLGRSDIKVSEMTRIDDERVLVLERGSHSTKLFIVRLDPARRYFALHDHRRGDRERRDEGSGARSRRWPPALRASPRWRRRRRRGLGG